MIADIPQLLASFASATEDAPALTFYRGKTLVGRLPYRELATRVDALAGHLHTVLGVRAGDRVAVLAPNRLEVPVAVLALMRLGAAVVPLNPTSPVEDWAYILQHSRARGLFATKALAERVPVTLEFTLHLEALALTDAVPPPAGAFAESPAVVLYTSGTTGNPKGVVLRQRNLLANARGMAQNFSLAGVTQLAVLPLYHAHAFGFGLMTALSTGGHLVFTDALEPFTWANVIVAESVSVTSVVPTMIPMLLAARVAADKVPTLRHILVSSAPLSKDLARQFAATQIPLIQGWGLSEYTNFACCVDPGATPEERTQLMYDEEVPSIGSALDGTEVRVVDLDGNVLGERARGELQVRGKSAMLGYLDDPEATARTFDTDGWLRTGDEGYFVTRERAVYFVTGRLKEIIIRDAEKHSPLRIEAKLLAAVPELAGRFVILGFNHRTHGEEIGAYIEVDTLDEALRAKLLGAVDALPVAERPKVILFGAAPIPRTHTGKIQRRKLKPLFAAYEQHRGPTAIYPG